MCSLKDTEPLDERVSNIVFAVLFGVGFGGFLVAAMVFSILGK